MNKIDTLIIIGVVFLVYFLPMIVAWFAVRNEFKYSNKNPTLGDLFRVIAPGFNMVFSIFFIAMWISDLMENKKFNFSKFFKL